MKLRTILEARKTKTVDIVDIPFDLSNDDASKNVPAAPKQDASLPARKTSAKVGSLGRVASQNATIDKASNVELPDSAMGRIRDLMTNIPDDDAPEQPGTDLDQPVTADNVPATIQNAMTTAGLVSPEWHRVGNLPGYMLGAIRRLAGQLFAQYTSIDVDDIQMVGNLGGQGPNTNREVQAVAKWASSEGVQRAIDTVDFSQVMPGYTAEIRVYEVGDVEVMLVKDEYGQYIYAWPNENSDG